MTRSGYAKHSGVTEAMDSFQSLHANRAARDPLPIVIVAVAMPLVFTLYAASSKLLLSQGMASSFLEATQPQFHPAMRNQRAHDPSAADNSPPTDQTPARGGLVSLSYVLCGRVYCPAQPNIRCLPCGVSHATPATPAERSDQGRR